MEKQAGAPWLARANRLDGPLALYTDAGKAVGESSYRVWDIKIFSLPTRPEQYRATDQGPDHDFVWKIRAIRAIHSVLLMSLRWVLGWLGEEDRGPVRIRSIRFA